MRFLLIAILTILFSTALVASNQVEMRLNTNRMDHATMTLYVDVDMKNSDRGVFILAGQNYRFFYDSESLSFSDTKSKSALSLETYSNLKIVDHKMNIVADEINQLDFDDNLGFINFSIDLIDHVNGGILVGADQDWTTVATLAFSVVDGESVQSIVWGREGVSDQYATAYAEVSEWISTEKIEMMTISDFQDFKGDENTIEDNMFLADMSIGPNPAIEFVKISFDQMMSQDVNVVVRDLQGRQMANQKIAQGEQEAIIEVAEWASANYFLEISSSSEGVLHTDRLSIVH